MKLKFYKIKQEANGFSRPRLTSMGHIHEDVQTIHTFKDAPDNRYIRVGYSDNSNDEASKLVENKLKGMCSYETCSDSDSLDKLFESCKDRKEGRNYILYFDRATFVR